MLRRLVYYIELAFHDVLRFRSATVLQGLIVAGVCFPILILMTLKRGHVADLRHDLVTSPTGRLVKVFPAAGGEPFTIDQMDGLAQSLGNVEVAIPFARRFVSLCSVDGMGKPVIVENVELWATAPGDPILASQRADVLRTDETAIVLHDGLAKALATSTGSYVTLRLQRPGTSKPVKVRLLVKAIIAASSDEKMGYVDISVFDRITRYQRNQGVPEWAWPGMSTPPKERYPQLLLVSDISDPLGEIDLACLRGEGFTVEEVTDRDVVTLGGALPATAASQVIIYRLTRKHSTSQLKYRISDDLARLADRTLATDCILPWCRPRRVTINRREVELVGLTMPTRSRWFRNMLLAPELPFEKWDPYRQVRALGASSYPPTTLQVIGGSLQLNVAIDSVVSEESKPPSSAVADPKPGPTKMPVTDAGDGADATMPNGIREEHERGGDRKSASSIGPRDLSDESFVSLAKGPAEQADASLPQSIQHPKEQFPATPGGDIANTEPDDQEAEAKGDGHAVGEDTRSGGPIKLTTHATGHSPQPAGPTPEPAAHNGSDVAAKDASVSPATPVLPSTLFVPAQLLSYLDEYEAGVARYDEHTGELVAILSEPTYEDILLFACTIDDVPGIVENAVRRGFPFHAQNARIEEIQQQGRSLERLILVVALLVFSFGILTVFGVLWESTARKRHLIGITRAMGVTPRGAFTIVVTRAMLLGVLAAVTTILFGLLSVTLLSSDPIADQFADLDTNGDNRLSSDEYGGDGLSGVQEITPTIDTDGNGILDAAEFRQLFPVLGRKPVVSAQLTRSDLWFVALISIVCCLVGAIGPGISAARLDPFDALVQGRFR